MEMKMEETKAGEEVEMEGDMVNHPELSPWLQQIYEWQPWIVLCLIMLCFIYC